MFVFFLISVNIKLEPELRVFSNLSPRQEKAKILEGGLFPEPTPWSSSLSSAFAPQYQKC
jgi:hypothetical protein